METILQLGRVKATAAAGTSFGSDFGPQLEITIEGQKRILVHPSLNRQITAILEFDNSASIRSIIQEACGLTVQNAIVELNSFIEEPVVRISGEAPNAEDRASVPALFSGELPFPLNALPETIRTFAESEAMRLGAPVCVLATACLALHQRL